MHDPRHEPSPDCLELFKKLSAYIDGESDPGTCEKIETHAARCIKCSICLETLKQTVDLCKSLPDEPVPDDFSKRLGTVFAHLIKSRSG